MIIDTNLAKFKDILKETSRSDFDGHTEFYRLTPEQRLFWLSQCAQFVSEIKTENKI
jgi:hypothetical protein